MSGIPKMKKFMKAAITLPLKITLKVLKYILYISLIIVALYTAKEAYDYYKHSRQYTSSDLCNEYGKAMTSLLGKINGSFICLNVSDDGRKLKPKDNRYFVMFLANEDSPTLEATGHGWVIWASASITNEREYCVSEFLPVGFGPQGENPKWPDPLVKYYAKMQRLLPKSIEPTVTRLLKYLYMPMQQSNEGAPTIENTGTCHIVGKEFRESQEFHKVFGFKPEVILTVSVSKIDYDNSKKYLKRFQEKDYRILLNDCTTFVYDVADELNLYTPPRYLNPFPFDSVSAISKSNRRIGTH